MMVPHSKSIRFPRTFRRNPFCADTGKIRRKFPYIECNRNSTNTERELYEWDYRNRLTSVTQQEWDSTTETWTTTQTIEYAYDYNNVWIRKVLDSNGDGTADSKSIFIPENYQTVLQLDDTNLTDTNAPAITHHYLWTPNAQDKLFADTTADGVLWSFTDHLGTIRDIIGNSTTHLIYDAFGNLVSGTNPILFGFTGKAFDTDTALQNNINRWYDATIGRWLSTDPIGFEGNDTNLYRYVQNSPISFFDNDGLAPNPLNNLLAPYKKVMKELYKGFPGGRDIGVYQYWKVTDHDQERPQELHNAESLARTLGWNSYSIFHLVFPSPKDKILNAVKDLQKKLGSCYSISHRFYGTVCYKNIKYRDRYNIEQKGKLFNFTYYSELTIIDETVTPSKKTIERDILIYGTFPLDLNGKNIASEVHGQFLY